ncbi:MAG TPA: hypothetical protein VGW39_06480 [Chthoniobacterales bacterium]|nr:hypothetical protein [Chthoniobacterales bacterium]
MNLTPRFFRFGAVCAMLTALTTLVVHIVPNLWADATTFDQQVELRLDPIYMAQRWTVLVHCTLVILSMFALGAAKLRSAPVLVSFGFLGYLCFGFTEIVRTSISIFAVNRTWRAGYAAAADDATREQFRSLITAYGGINDALFFIFYTGFMLGLVCYGLAFLRTEGGKSQLGLLFLVWAALDVPGFIATVTGTESMGRYFEWVGPYFLPLARLYVGVWLWKNADRPG